MSHTTLYWVLIISGLFSDCQGKACENGGTMDFNACACTCKTPTTTYVGPSCQCKYRLSKKLQISRHVRFRQILYFRKQAAIIQRRVIWIFFLILQYLIVPNCFIRTCTCLFIFFLEVSDHILDILGLLASVSVHVENANCFWYLYSVFNFFLM